MKMKNKTVAIIDYGVGNLKSIEKAIDHIGCRVLVTSDKAVIQEADGLILPGVGAFHDAINQLDEADIITDICEFASSTKPVLGICLGMQLLQTISYENGQWEGLNIIEGEVHKFPEGEMRVPHIGWNTIKKIKKREDGLLKNIPSKTYFYFVHSYYVLPTTTSVIEATTEYGILFSSVINMGNVWGIQFHPEKSQKMGLQVLKNFCELL